MSTQNLQNELKNCTTINEAIQVTNKYYDLDSKLGAMSKGIVISGIPKLIKMTGTKEREKR